MELSVGRGRSADSAPVNVDVQTELNEVARPRLAGSDGAARVTEHIRASLASLGYDVRSHHFRFNPWPGRFGVSLAGVLYTGAAFWAASMLYAARPYSALAPLLLAVLLAGVVIWLGRPWLDGWDRALRDGENLLAMPGAGRPKYLVVAHRDSKSQPVPLAFRGPAIAAALLTWLALFIMALLSIAQPVPRGLVLLVGAVAVAAGITLVGCRVDNASPGALDNASGVVTLLGIAAEQRQAGDVAFLVTDAEELGLAGSRAIARLLPNFIGAINLDGIDDAGPFHLMERFGWPRKRGRAPHLAAALLRAGFELKLDVRRRDAPFGIMLDHMPLVDGGTPALSVLRGTFHSLSRVHRPADDLASLRGTGIEPAIRLVSRALAVLRAQEPGRGKGRGGGKGQA